MILLVVGGAVLSVVFAFLAALWNSSGVLRWPILGILLALVLFAIKRSVSKRQAARELAQANYERQLQMDRDFEHTRTLSPRQFEEQVARLLRRDGWLNASVVGGANDRGADVIATRHGHKMVVQCKRYFGHKVTSREMQQFVGMCYDEHRATIAVYVTTSSFTKEARAIATSRRVVLVEEQDFSRWQSFSEGDFLRIGATP